MKKQSSMQAGLPAVASAEAGQTLLEILLAFGVSIMVLSAIVIGITTSLSNAQYTKNQGLANSYAKEAMAVVRKMKESDWAQFTSYTQPIYCLNQNSVILSDPPLPSNCGQNVVDIFSRKVKLEHASESCIADPSCSGPSCLRGSKVTVTVSWADNKCPIGNPICHNVELITCFSNI